MKNNTVSVPSLVLMIVATIATILFFIWGFMNLWNFSVVQIFSLEAINMYEASALLLLLGFIRAIFK
jgi:hypothetical protein